MESKILVKWLTESMFPKQLLTVLRLSSSRFISAKIWREEVRTPLQQQVCTLPADKKVCPEPSRKFVQSVGSAKRKLPGVSSWFWRFWWRRSTSSQLRTSCPVSAATSVRHQSTRLCYSKSLAVNGTWYFDYFKLFQVYRIMLIWLLRT